MHQVGDNPSVHVGNSQFVPEHAIRQVGQLVGDDDGRARASDSDHFAQGAFGVVKVVEGADAQDGVELTALEGEILGFALGQPDGTAGRAATAGLELGAGDVNAHDLPVAGQPVEIDSIADSDVEKVKTGRRGKMAQHPIASAALTAVAEPGEPLPKPELGPEWAVVETLGNLVVIGGLILDEQNAILNRQTSRTGCAGECGSSVVNAQSRTALRALPAARVIPVLIRILDVESRTGAPSFFLGWRLT